MADKKSSVRGLMSGASSTWGGKSDPEISDLDEGVIKATGVGLKEGEIAALEAIGMQLGELLGTEAVARNALVRIAVRELIKAHRAGTIDLAAYFEKPAKPKPRLK